MITMDYSNFLKLPFSKKKILFGYPLLILLTMLLFDLFAYIIYKLYPLSSFLLFLLSPLILLILFSIQQGYLLDYISNIFQNKFEMPKLNLKSQLIKGLLFQIIFIISSILFFFIPSWIILPFLLLIPLGLIKFLILLISVFYLILIIPLFSGIKYKYAETLDIFKVFNFYDIIKKVYTKKFIFNLFFALVIALSFLIIFSLPIMILIIVALLLFLTLNKIGLFFGFVILFVCYYTFFVLGFYISLVVDSILANAYKGETSVSSSKIEIESIISNIISEGKKEVSKKRRKKVRKTNQVKKRKK